MTKNLVLYFLILEGYIIWFEDGVNAHKPNCRTRPWAWGETQGLCWLPKAGMCQDDPRAVCQQGVLSSS